MDCYILVDRSLIPPDFVLPPLIRGDWGGIWYRAEYLILVSKHFQILIFLLEYPFSFNILKQKD